MSSTDLALLDIVRETLQLALIISAPILGAGIVIGLFISVLQSVTSIQEQALTFVPKIFGMILVAVALMSWIVAKVSAFAVVMFSLG